MQEHRHHLTDEDMGKIIGVSRNSYSQKIWSGRFWPGECRALCKYFNKPFEYLFATEGDKSTLGRIEEVMQESHADTHPCKQ